MRPYPASSVPGHVAGAAPPGGAARRRPLLVAVLAACLGLMTLWAGTASYLVLFRDDLIVRFATQQRAMQAAYDARVGDLQSQVDRAASEGSLTRDGLEGRLAALAERQDLLEERQGRLSNLTATTTVTTTGALPAGPAPADPMPAKPAPHVRMPLLTPELRMRGEDRAEAPDHGIGARMTTNMTIRMAALDARLDGLAERQMRTVSAVAAAASRNAGRLRSVILQAGLRPARYEKPEAGLGGPLVPVSGEAFDIALAEAQRAAGTERRLRRAVTGLPFRKPLRETFALSSDFGMRLDPFTRGLAMHTGIDMRADHGASVRATASGRVTAAEASGGYGNMVEVDHGHGLATRYAHLSAYTVAPGQWVEAGAILGRVGSTGRSTGNHLHYETRVDGEPVDPQPFLRVADGPGLDVIGDR